MKKLLLKLISWVKKMFGFEVIGNDGIVISSEDVFFSMQESEITIPAKTNQTIRPNDKTDRVAYALSPIAGMYTGFSMTLNADGSMTVNNNCGFSISITILRY